MIHLIVVSKDEARDIVLSALRDKGYEVVMEGVDEAMEHVAEARGACSASCSLEKILEVLERFFEKSAGEKSFYHFALSAVEKPMIEKALAKTGGNQLAAARMLGINRNTIRAKIRRLGIRMARGQRSW